MMSKPCEKFVGKSWAQILKYSKITTSSITTNARLQQDTFTCLFKNLKMLPGNHPIFSLVSQSYARLRIILFSKNFYRKTRNVCTE